MKEGAYQKLDELGIRLPPPPPDQKYLRMVRPFGENMLYISGMGSIIEGQECPTGSIPSDVAIDDGVVAAKNCVLNALSALDAYLGDLGKIKRFVKLLAFVSSDPDFYNQATVANGGSKLLIDIFGDEIGKATRSAVGVAALPNNFPVEIEMLVELDS